MTISPDYWAYKCNGGGGGVLMDFFVAVFQLHVFYLLFKLSYVFIS